MRISDWSSDVCSSDLSYGMGVASQNIGVLFITKEMSSAELTGRCLSDRMFSRNPILYERIANGWMNDDEQRRIEALSEELSRLPFQIVDSARVTPARVTTWVRRWQRRFQAQGVELEIGRESGRARVCQYV